MTLGPLPGLTRFSASSGQGAAQRGVGEVGKVSLEGIPLCPNFFHLFLFSEGYQITKEGWEKKKILCCFKICWGKKNKNKKKSVGESPISSLNLPPFFFLLMSLNGLGVYQEGNRRRSGPCLSFTPIRRKDNAFCCLRWWWW